MQMEAPRPPRGESMWPAYNTAPPLVVGAVVSHDICGQKQICLLVPLLSIEYSPLFHVCAVIWKGKMLKRMKRLQLLLPQDVISVSSSILMQVERRAILMSAFHPVLSARQVLMQIPVIIDVKSQNYRQEELLAQKAVPTSVHGLWLFWCSLISNLNKMFWLERNVLAVSNKWNKLKYSSKRVGKIKLFHM